MNISKWMVIANPKAGANKVAQDWPIISDLLTKYGISFDVMFTKHKFHSIELTVKAIKEGYRKFISVGGDGTIHEVVNGIFFQDQVPYSELTLGVIPSGSGNDWMKMFDVSKDYEKAVQTISKGKTIFQDVCKMEMVESMVKQTRYMINVAGIGFDAMICHHCNKNKEQGKKGKLIYIIAAMQAFFDIKPKLYKVVVDGKEYFKGKVFSTAFGVGRYSGGGMTQMPDAVVNDGLVNLTVIEKMPKLKIATKFVQLFTGRIYSIPGVHHIMGKHIEVETVPNDIVEVDGEVLGTTPLDLTIMPQALRVVVGENFTTDPRL